MPDTSSSTELTESSTSSDLSTPPSTRAARSQQAADLAEAWYTKSPEEKYPGDPTNPMSSANDQYVAGDDAGNRAKFVTRAIDHAHMGGQTTSRLYLTLRRRVGNGLARLGEWLSR